MKKLTKNTIIKEGYYAKFKNDFKDKIIDYSYSPTGKAYVGTNKKPFMKVATGYGFQGVLMQDDARRLVQCHICGKWFKKIASKHIKCKHGITVEEYKDQFGLFRKTGLVSDETSLRLTVACLKNKKPFGNRPFTKGGSISKKAGTAKTAYQNRHGTCPAQIKERVYEFIRCNRELPARQNRGYALYKILKKRYGTFGDGLQALGLPHYKRQGTNYVYTFPDYTVYKFNINKFHSREELYALMLDKCPVFKLNQK